MENLRNQIDLLEVLLSLSGVEFVPGADALVDLVGPVGNGSPMPAGQQLFCIPAEVFHPGQQLPLFGQKPRDTLASRVKRIDMNSQSPQFDPYMSRRLPICIASILVQLGPFRVAFRRVLLVVSLVDGLGWPVETPVEDIVPLHAMLDHAEEVERHGAGVVTQLLEKGNRATLGALVNQNLRQRLELGRLRLLLQ